MKECYNSIVNDLQFLQARPRQSLKTHIYNMIEQIPKIINRVALKVPIYDRTSKAEKWIKFNKDFLNIYLTIIFASHDFGKLSPVFQQKILTIGIKKKRKRAKSKCLKYSHHTQSSSFFCYLLLTQLLNNLIIKNNELTLNGNITQNLLQGIEPSPKLDAMNDLYNISEIHGSWDAENQIDLYKFLLLKIGIFSVLMHHNRSLDSTAIKFIESEDYLQGIFQLIFDFKIAYNVDIFAEVYANILSGSFWKNILNNSIKVISNISDDNYLDIFSIYEDLEVLPEKFKHQKYSIYVTLFSFVFSCLTEADEWDAKSYIDDTSNHSIEFEPNRLSLEKHKIDNYRMEKFGMTIEVANNKYKIEQLNQIRRALYDNLDEHLEKMDSIDLNKIFVIDAPTGSGKTLALLNAGIKCRNKIEKDLGYKPRIIYALPFISIIDQLGVELKDIFMPELSKVIQNIDDSVQNQYFALHHHQAGDKWLLLEEDEKDEEGTTIVRGNHFINTWHSEIIVTSFVRLFHTLLKSHKREFIRFHRLASSIILIDEIQGVPAKYWELIQSVLVNISKILGCTIFLASATPPIALLPTDQVHIENMNLIPQEMKSALNRYRLNVKCLDGNGDVKPTYFEDFTLDLKNEIKQEDFQSLMIVLNTTRAAYSLFQYLETNVDIDIDNLFLLSSLILPNHRKETIEKIKSILKKKSDKIILVCTQVIEAGVDVSFQKVIRDFGPLDSIIQVAGRCNRSFEYKNIGEVDIYQFVGKKVGDFSRMVYSESITDLQETRRILHSFNKQPISEQEISNKISLYFSNLKSMKVTDKLVDAYFNGMFGELYSGFRLIDNKDYNETLILGFDENYILINELIDFGQRKSFPKGLASYVLETSKANINYIKTIIADDKIVTIYQKRKKKRRKKVLTIIDLRDLKDREMVYSKHSGLRVESVFEFENLPSANMR